MNIIGITGAAGSGKDTVAEIIAGSGNGFVKRSFATPLKNMLKALGLNDEQLDGDLKEVVDERFGHTPRYMMQTLGTEWARNTIDPEIWVKAVFYTLESYVVLSDVRFDNEAEMVRDKGLLIHMVGRNKIIPDTHGSEAGVEFIEGDLKIHNTGTLSELFGQVGRLLPEIIKRSDRWAKK